MREELEQLKETIVDYEERLDDQEGLIQQELSEIEDLRYELQLMAQKVTEIEERLTTEEE